MRKQRNDNDDVVIVPVPMDRATRERLAFLSRQIGDQPINVAGALLRDLLQEDELYNERPPGAPLN